MTSSSPHRSLRMQARAIAGLLAAGTTAALLLLTAGPASGAVACTWSAVDETVSIVIAGADNVVIGRTAGGALNVTGTGNSVADPTCGGATMTHIGVISVDVTGDTTTTPAAQKVTIDLTNGLFEPGNDLEGMGTSPEIEFDVDLGPGTSDEVIVKGAATADNVAFGADGINFRPTELSPDNDFVALANVEKFGFEGHNGDDTVSGQGGSGTGAATSLPMAINGGSGLDALTGGSGTDTFNEGTLISGADVIEGKLGVDTVVYDRGSGDPVTVSIDGVGNDGSVGENDNVDVENITGGDGNDTLSGTVPGAAGVDSEANNTFSGDLGTDTVTYAGRTENFIITIGGTATTGAESDQIGATNDIENVTGGSGADSITGDLNVNIIDGGPGNDTLLDGMAGDDTIKGGAGDDTIEGGADEDTLIGGPGNDDMEGEADGATLADSDKVDYSGSGPMVVNLATGSATGDGTDTLGTIEEVIGSPGADSITGGTGNEILNGRAGDDTLVGGAGDDTLNGNDGTDTVTYVGSTGPIAVDLRGAASQASGDGSDIIATVEKIIGSPASDTFKGSAGNDDFDGHTGNGDTVDYAATSAGVVVNLAAQSSSGDGTDVLKGFEHVTGSTGNDSITGDSNANTLAGGAGNDTILGGPGGDNITGSAGDDTINGGDGNDSLDGGTTPATTGTTPGSDTLSYDGAGSAVTVDLAIVSPATQATGGAGSDTITGFENLTGSSHGDTLSGDATANTITGGDGDDIISGKVGDDTLVGGAGDDRLSATGGNDRAVYSGAPGPVTVDLNASPQTATGHGSDTLAGIVHVTGSPYDDTITGEAGANNLDGLAGNDLLVGNDGADDLDGGDGDDILRSGSTTAATTEPLSGGNGSDTADYSTYTAGGVTANLLAPAVNTGDAAADTYSSVENLSGSAGADKLTGNGDPNKLSGLAGNDELDGGAGNDILAGGTGDDKFDTNTADTTDLDTVDYSAAGGPVTVNLATATAQNTGEGSDTIAASVDNVTGSNFADTLLGDSGNNVITGGGGSDTVSYANAATTGVTVDLAKSTAPQATGTSAGNDTLAGIENVIGSPQNDTIGGNGGNNTLDGGDGDDTLDGAGGADTENGGNGNDQFSQGTAPNGGDTMAGGDGADTVNYGSRTGTINVTRNGAADDGAPGEGDNVGSDVEGDTTPATAPSAPRNVSATAGNRSATVTWTAPESTGGNAISGYRVTASPGGTTASTAGDQRSAVVGGLTSGTSYTFTVVATNGQGTGPASSPSNAVVPKAADGTTGTQGYTMVDAAGAVYNFGTSKFFGSMSGQSLNSPMIGVAHTPTGNGYWLVARDGGIFSFGDAKFYGSMGAITLNSPVLGMEPTPTGKGYWLFAGDGGIFSFGDATFFGSMGGKQLNQPMVGMASTSTGKGYWLVASDGGIFSFGDAKFYGSMGGKPLNQPVFDIAGGPGDKGYWLVARDGGMFTFGDIGFYGSAASSRPATVIGMGATPAGKGYWIADERGVVYNFGDAEAVGDFRNAQRPVVGFAPMPKK